MIDAVARVVFKVGGHAGSAAAAATGWPGGSDDVEFRCASLQPTAGCWLDLLCT
jgi:hypothetical protein